MKLITEKNWNTTYAAAGFSVSVAWGVTATDQMKNEGLTINAYIAHKREAI